MREGNRTRRDILRTIRAASALGFGAGSVGADDDEVRTATPTPPVEEIPAGGAGEGFDLVGHAPLLDDHQYVGDETFGIPRGSNGDIAVAGDCVYVGSFVGYQPPLIVDLEDPTGPEVVGPIPDAVPGVGNGIEGIAASDDVLVIDQRDPIGRLGFSTPEGDPERGLSVYDVTAPREPELVARRDADGLDVHSTTLWRDPEEPERLLALQSYTDVPNIRVFDLTGCPDDCDPEVVAEWALETQVGIAEHTHEAVFSTDGRRVYVSQYRAGVFLLDSTNLLEDLREDTEEYDPASPESTPGEDHRLTLLNPDPGARLETAPPFDGEWHHTPLKVPDRPYLLALAESAGPRWDADDEAVIAADCPGAFSRLVYVGEGMGGDRHPGITGVFGLPEQRLENCGPDGWDDDVARPAWLSPHYATVFPDVAFVTYYSGGLRAVDLSNPFTPVEAGYFFNEPVEAVRWASYGITGEPEPLEDVDEDDLPDGLTEDDVAEDDLVVRQPAPGPNHMFAFSYPVIYDSYVVYADVHSGLFVLEYDGRHADQLPDDGPCVSGNPGAVEPGYEPCPPYGETD